MIESGTPSDDALLDRFQHAAFNYFLQNGNPTNGLIADTSRIGAPCSIAVVGFALSSYVVAVERGWLARANAVERTLIALRFFWNSPQNEQLDATGYRGFYYHFLDMSNGRRVWQSEISMVDTALLLAGVLMAGVYFTEKNQNETEIRELAQALYLRTDWQWAQNGEASVRQGWKPESGFLHYGWDGYTEATILYILGLASPSHPLPETSYKAWTMSYQWENIYNIDFLYAGPLFLHQFSHAWIDFKGIRDPFMQGKDCDYFENSRRAVKIQREYARRNPYGFTGYSENCWGLSAGDGPGFYNKKVNGRDRRLYGYVARGVPYGPDDGTIAPWSSLASLPFAPEIVLPTLRHLCTMYPDIIQDSRFPSGFNPTLPAGGPSGWISDGYFGLDQGILVLMIENFRSQLIWKLMRSSLPISSGLRRAGFKGGWL
jgi:hypothetical protein